MRSCLVSTGFEHVTASSRVFWSLSGRVPRDLADLDRGGAAFPPQVRERVRW